MRCVKRAYLNFWIEGRDGVARWILFSLKSPTWYLVIASLKKSTYVAFFKIQTLFPAASDHFTPRTLRGAGTQAHKESIRRKDYLRGWVYAHRPWDALRQVEPSSPILLCSVVCRLHTDISRRRGAKLARSQTACGIRDEGSRSALRVVG